MENKLDELARYVRNASRPVADFTPQELQNLADQLGVDDIYLLDSNTNVVATNYLPDLHFQISTVSAGMASLLRSLFHSDKIFVDSINISTRTHIFKKYAYRGVLDADYIVEIGMDVRKYLRKKRGETYEKYLFDDLFNNISPETGYHKEFDIYRVNALDILPFFNDSPVLDKSIVTKLEQQDFLIEPSESDIDIYSKIPSRYDQTQMTTSTEYWLIHSRFDRTPFVTLQTQAIHANMVILGIGILLTIMAIFLFYKRVVVRQINTIKIALQTLARGDYTQTVTVRGSSELDDIANYINITRKLIHERSRELEYSYATIEQFFYMAAHDLKSPIRAIRHYIELIDLEEGEKLSDKNRHRMAVSLQTTHTMETLLNELMSFSKVSSQDMNMTPYSMQTLVQTVIADIRILYPDQDLCFIIQDELPLISCDTEKVRMLFHNMLINSIKYNKNDKKEISIGHTFVAGIPVFHVRDNGIGIHKNYPASIFELFHRLPDSRQYSEGTGVGMTIIKKVIQRHGGRIWLESSPGQGTIFYFTLEPDV